MNVNDLSKQIAEAVMDAIERRQGILKDDIADAARGVLAKNQTGSSYNYGYTALLMKAQLDPSVAGIYAAPITEIWSSPHGTG